MQIIPAGEFKTHCLKLMDQVANSHEELVITKRGVPVAKMVPIEISTDPFGLMKGSIIVEGNIVSYDLSEAWEVDPV
ncbi:MAG: type II toxin-antitoxin system Phd/YefM family antitoxin [Alphaproteobacteria bacterium]|nr:type II toxin-antitoxin system Phd/YefM family antitoxin [Alphaproteobacteria bacterium]